MDPVVRPAAKVVGDAFAELYYLVLQKHPNHLREFYKADSKIKRPGLDGSMRDFSISDIDANDLNMLSSGGFASVDVTIVTSQDSLDGSVFVVVDGYFNSKERRRARKFTQTFFLAPQENGYYTYNDLFKFIDISEANQSIPSANNVTEQNVPEIEQVADESSNASVVQIGQGQHASFPEIKTDEVDDNVNGNNQESQVFVKGFPSNATNYMIENAFKQFGPVKRVAIKHPGMAYYYAFVEFEEADAAKKAIKASPMWICGRKVHVAKKRDTVNSALWEWKKSMNS